MDFSSALNTVVPHKLVNKLRNLGLTTKLCSWILDFLTNRPQNVRVGDYISSTLTLVPQGCVLSPALFTLFTHDCTPIYSSNSMVKFADDTTVVGLISGNDETHYNKEVQHLVMWCSDNDLVLNTTKTKEIIVDYRRTRKMTPPPPPPPLHIHGEEVENVNNIKFLGLYITNDLTWTINSLLGEEGSAEAFLPEKAQESQSTISAFSELLQEYNRKHSLPLYYCVVYQLHYTESKRSCTDS